MQNEYWLMSTSSLRQIKNKGLQSTKHALFSAKLEPHFKILSPLIFFYLRRKLVGCIPSLMRLIFLRSSVLKTEPFIRDDCLSYFTLHKLVCSYAFKYSCEA